MKILLLENILHEIKHKANYGMSLDYLKSDALLQHKYCMIKNFASKKPWVNWVIAVLIAVN